jgi:hypothetical protein
MTRDQIKDVLDRVLTWPPERQQDAARILTEMEAQNASSYHLTDEQVEEVKRRLADPQAQSITMAEVRARLSKLGQ